MAPEQSKDLAVGTTTFAITAGEVKQQNLTLYVRSVLEETKFAILWQPKDQTTSGYKEVHMKGWYGQERTERRVDSLPPQRLVCLRVISTKGILMAGTAPLKTRCIPR